LEQLRGEVEPGGGRRSRSGFARVHRLVALRLGQRLGDVRRQRHVARRLTVQPHAPASFAEVLEQLHVPVSTSGAQTARGSRQSLPDAVRSDLLEQQDLAAGALDRDPRRHDTRVVDHDERVADDVRQVCERSVMYSLLHAIVDQESRLVSDRNRPLRDQISREVVVQLVDSHPDTTVQLPQMDESAIERAKQRVEQRAEAAALDEVLDHTRAELEALVRVVSTAAAGLAEQIETAVKDGVREEAQPMARYLAENRGLMNQVIRRLERIETDGLAERHARVDDLALLVDLISSSWKSVDARLGRVEAVINRLEQGLTERGGAIVYRIEDRRPDVAN
jgi:hypothetical protein